MHLRAEQPADRAAIHAVVTAAFGRVDEADLVDRLREEGSGVVSLVSLDADAAVTGHVLLSRMDAPFRALGLAPLSVLPARQRSGIGSQLVRAALQYSKDLGWEAVFVLGDPQYYGRFGFNAEHASGFSSPYAGPHLMIHALTGSLPVSAGSIAYARPFASLG
ncbi:MAG: N-acetyltransferase [Proteobacteria bacterium]|nr:N-acetyltransferase [Pseudomonadota bacterium]